MTDAATKTPPRNYLYEPGNCPSQHNNDGNDVCEDCGHFLNAAMTEETDPAKLARAKRLGYTVVSSIDDDDQARIYAFVRPNGEQDGEWFPLEEMAWDGAAGDSGLWALDHGDPDAPAAAPVAAPAPETRNVCVISTAHLTPETVAVLSGDRAGWPIYGGAYGPASPDGFFVHVAEPGDDELPADLTTCCAWAHALRFDYIMFDADADARPDLPTYEH